MSNLILTVLLASAFSFTSPDGRLRASVEPCGDHVEYTLECDGKTLISPSGISMTLADGVKIPSGRLIGKNLRSADTVFDTPVYKKAQVRDRYNELCLKFNGSNVFFRLYDNAFAWRFEIAKRKPYEVCSEQAQFRLPEDWNLYATYTHKYCENGLESQYCDDFENLYKYFPVSQWDQEHFATMPLMVECPDGVKMVITEADVISYPGMFLYNEDGSTTISGRNAAVPSEFKIAGHAGLQEMVVARHPYIAKCDGSQRTFPWRVVAVSHKDTEMADNDIVMCLGGEPEKGADFSWVKPGRVAWDWLNAWGLTGMDFKAGINTQTYKYYIDFASRNGLEYIIMDEGWAAKRKNDLFDVVPAIDLEEIISYAESRNVGVLLWAGHYPFAKDMQRVCEHYSAMGVKGFKIDFMNRDDQAIEEFMYSAAQMCAKYHLLLDFHGTHKPVGLQRRFPNIVNVEGIFGLEQMRGKTLPEYDMVTTDVILPYVRYVAGFADYTPGFMRNASYKNHRPVSTEPMSQGTRCRQLAEYVVFDAPLNMLADSPTNYDREPDCLAFITAVPTVWDEVRILDGQVGQYIISAKRKGDVWYIGAMTDWNERDVELDLTSLVDGEYEADCYMDGFIAGKIASDFRRKSISGSQPLNIHMAQGGGFAAIVRKK